MSAWPSVGFFLRACVAGRSRVGLVSPELFRCFSKRIDVPHPAEELWHVDQERIEATLWV